MTTIQRILASWQDSLHFLIGAHLFFSPWLFGFRAEQTAALNAHVVDGRSGSAACWARGS